MAETQVAGEDEVALQGLGGRPSRKESLWKKRHSRNALLVAAVLIVTIIIIIIIIVYKVYQNDIFGYEGFQAVLPQKEICFDPDDPSTYAKYVEVLNKTIEPYEQSKIEGNRIDCAKAAPKEDEVCHFADTWLNNCRKGILWGFKSSRPCIILTLNRDINFIPEPFSSSDDLPDEMPEDIKDEIKDPDNDFELIGVHCSHAGGYDPFPGFFKNFIINIDRTDSLPPLVGVTFDLHEEGHLDVECTLWSKTSPVNPFRKVYFKIGKRC